MTNSLYAESDGDLRMLILAWYRRARIANQAHAHAASRARHIKAFLGIPAVALSAIAGSAIFANIDKAPNKILQITAGVLTLTAAILAALQGFLKFDEQIQEHESASRAFGAIRRELGLVGAMTGQSREEKISLLDSIRKEYDQASAASRNVPERVWKRIADRSNVFWPPEFLAWPEVPGGR